MKKRLFSLALAVIMIFSLVPVPARAAETPVEVTVAGTEHYGYTAEVFDMVNTSRVENNLSELTRNATLTELAMQRAAEIALYYDSDHLRPDNSQCSTIADGVYTGWKNYGENIAIGQIDAAEVMDAWMNSAGHRSNILGEEFTQIGVGCFEADGVCCWVQLFGNSTSNTNTTNTTGSVVTTRDVTILPSNLDLRPTGAKSLELEPGESAVLTITSTNPGFSYIAPVLIPKTENITSGGTTIATVSASDDGTITVIGKNPGTGTAQITVYDGQTSPLKLTVTVPGAAETEPPVTTEPDPTEPEPTDPPETTEPADPDHVHVEEVRNAKEPTCEEYGYTGDIYCAECGALLEEGETIYNTGHTYGHWEVLDYPTEDHAGLKVVYCTVCGDGMTSGVMYPEDPHPDGYPIYLTYNDHGFSDVSITQAVPGHEVFLDFYPATGYHPAYIYYSTDADYCADPVQYGDYVCFTMPEGALYIEVVFAPNESPFVDVKESNYFYEPVLWAVSNGITSGIGNNRFGPSNPCTRAQVVTFLWRACGSPDPQNMSNPFTDVKESDYYYKAVLWAVENGITSGVSANRFGPGSPCTRAQVVTFLWRTADSPDSYYGYNPFSDVSSSSYYYNAVLWAVEYGITSGVDDTHFGPNNTCTRGQIVTFLYKAFHG